MTRKRTKINRQRVGTFKLATCQINVCGDIGRNSRNIQRQIIKAKELGADVAHFPECALSGYIGSDAPTAKDVDWVLLTGETKRICGLAKEQKIWVILGSSHRLTGKHRPHNCIYAINPQGKIKDRYDKLFCSPRDLEHYSPGDHFSVITINGVKCGMLVCADSRYPELYREYKKRGVQCVFHSFHITHCPGPNILIQVIPSTMVARAASNHLWISANNASTPIQANRSILVRPDGTIAASLKRNKPGIMVNAVDANAKLYDASAQGRKCALRGILHSGKQVKNDPRSKNRKLV